MFGPMHFQARASHQRNRHADRVLRGAVNGNRSINSFAESEWHASQTKWLSTHFACALKSRLQKRQANCSGSFRYRSSLPHTRQPSYVPRLSSAKRRGKRVCYEQQLPGFPHDRANRSSRRRGRRRRERWSADRNIMGRHQFHQVRASATLACKPILFAKDQKLVHLTACSAPVFKNRHNNFLLFYDAHGRFTHNPARRFHAFLSSGPCRRAGPPPPFAWPHSQSGRK